MSRGDPCYFKLDMDALHGEKIGRLSIPELHTYIWGYWRLSILRRSERLLNCFVTAQELSKNCHTGVRVVSLHTRKLHNLGLITVWCNGDVTVHGSRERHAKLRWNEMVPDCSVRELYRPYMGVVKITVQGIARQHDSTRGSIIHTPIPSSISSDISIPDRVDLESNQELGKNPDPAPRLDRMKVQELSWEICNGLGIDSNIKNMASLANMLASWPAPLVQDAFQKTADKQEADKAGTSQGRLKNPLGYMVGCLRKERK